VLYIKRSRNPKGRTLYHGNVKIKSSFRLSFESVVVIVCTTSLNLSFLWWGFSHPSSGRTLYHGNVKIKSSFRLSFESVVVIVCTTSLNLSFLWWGFSHPSSGVLVHCHEMALEWE